MKNLTISRKLLLGFGIPVIMMVAALALLFFDSGKTVTLACLGIAIIVTISMLFTTSRSIQLPVREFLKVFTELADGTLSTGFEYRGKDEFGEMIDLYQKANNLEGQVIDDIIKKLVSISEGDLLLLPMRSGI